MGRRVVCPERRHRRPNDGAIDLVAGQHARGFAVVGRFHPAAADDGSQVGPAPRLEIHREKGDVVGHVDPSQARAELNRIEGRHPACVEHEVGEVEVAVAFPDPPRSPPPLDHVGQRLEPREQPGLDPSQSIGGIGPVVAKLAEVDRHRQVDTLRRAPGVTGGRHREPLLDRGDRLAESLAVGGCKPAGGEPDVESVGLVELHELDGPFDRRPVASDVRGVGRAGDRHGGHVELRREPAADADLFLAKPPAALERGVVEEAEVERLLQLVDERAGEEDPGDVGLDQTDRRGGVRVGLRPAEPLDEAARVGRDDGGDGHGIRRQKNCRPAVARGAAAVGFARHHRQGRGGKPPRCRSMPGSSAAPLHDWSGRVGGDGGLRQRQARRLAATRAALRYSHIASLNHLLCYEDPAARLL